MKAKTLLTSLVIASMGISSLAIAQPSHHEARREAREDRREAKRDLREARRDLREVREDRREARQVRHAVYNARGHEFRRGGHLPYEMRDRRYVVADWHHHHLARPAPGYQWVQVGPDFVLAAIATGVIASLVLSR